jgi:hypothetical protein
MEELDLLKKAWQKAPHTYTEVSEQDIYKMLHRKSSSIVKWILIISILELVFWLVMNSLVASEDSEKYDSMEWKVVLDIATYVNYAVTAGFIYFFYKNYISISTTVSTRVLMSNILRTRRTIQYYVGYNLTMSALMFSYGLFVAIFHNKDFAQLRDMMTDGTHQMATILCIMVFAILIAVLLGILWLFYKLLYGILVKRLIDNYKELKKIDL